MKLIRSFLLISFVSLNLVGCQGVSNKEVAEPSKFKTNFTLAKTNGELMALRNNANANVIRTEIELKSVILSGNTPLSKLSKSEQEEFVKEGIVVRKGVGVVSINYMFLKTKMSYDDFAETMALFGLDIKEGYWGMSKDPVINQQLRKGGVKPTADELSQPISVGEDNSTSQIIAPPDTGDNPEGSYPGFMCDRDIPHTCYRSRNYICLSGC